MLVQRLRRWPNVSPTQNQCLMCVRGPKVGACQMHAIKHVLDQWCVDFEDDGPTLNRIA